VSRARREKRKPGTDDGQDFGNTYDALRTTFKTLNAAIFTLTDVVEDIRDGDSEYRRLPPNCDRLFWQIRCAREHVQFLMTDLLPQMAERRSVDFDAIVEDRRVSRRITWRNGCDYERLCKLANARGKKVDELLDELEAAPGNAPGVVDFEAAAGKVKARRERGGAS